MMESTKHTKRSAAIALAAAGRGRQGWSRSGADAAPDLERTRCSRAHTMLLSTMRQFGVHIIPHLVHDFPRAELRIDSMH